MKEPQRVFTKSSVNELIAALKDMPTSYCVYTSYAESLYVVTDAVEEMTVADLFDIFDNMEICKDFTVKLTPAENIDPDVDLSMIDEYDVAGISKDDICECVYIFAY